MARQSEVNFGQDGLDAAGWRGGGRGRGTGVFAEAGGGGGEGDGIDADDFVDGFDLGQVGGAGGPSAQPVNSDYKLNDNFTAKVINGNYKRDQTVDLLAWQDRTFTLSIGK